MYHRRLLADFGLSAAEPAPLDTPIGILQSLGIVVFNEEKVRDYKKKKVLSYERPILAEVLVYLIIAAAFVAIVFCIGWIAQVPFFANWVWAPPLALVALLVPGFVYGTRFASGWYKVYPIPSDGIPPELWERARKVQEALPEGHLALEKFRKDPFLLTEVPTTGGTQKIYFGVYDEKRGETYFA